MTNASQLLDALVGISHDAGDAIMAIYESADHGTTRKADDSPLTKADLAAHEIISRRLAALTPDLPIISEESDDHDQARLEHEKVWLVDPLDGTKEFIKRNGQFTVNIALIENGQPVLGVVYAPALQQTYAGIVGEGAWKAAADNKRETISVNTAGRPPIAVVSASHPSDELAAWLDERGITETTATGSSLKLCYVADGSADVYPRLAPTMEWDTAAGDAVVRAAGGTTLSYPTMDPVTYNKPDLLNPYFIAARSPEAAA